MRAVPRVRIAVLALVALLAAATLSACRSNVGYAATVDGKRYSESDISDYLTPNAAPVRAQAQNGAQTETPVRSFVVETVIVEKLFAKTAAALPGGGPSAATLAQLRASALQGASVSSAVRTAGIRGYSSAFDELLVRRVVLSQYLQSALQQGVDVQRVLASVPFSVSINPRYGTWDAKSRSFDGAPGVGAPSFLDLQSSVAPKTAATNGATTSP